jgi:hypothetical protein
MFRDYRWIEELAAQYGSPSEIPVPEIAELAEVVGIEAAIKTFRYYDGIPEDFPKKNIVEMEREYIRYCSADKSDKELARKFDRTLRHVQYIMAAPAKVGIRALSNAGQRIPLFPELEEEEN